MSELPLLPALEHLTWGRSAEVPSWALNADALNYAATRDQGHHQFMHNYAGPAALLAWRSLCWTSVIWLASPLITFVLLSKRPGGGGFPSPPPWLLPGLSLGTLLLLFLEHRARCIILVPITRHLTHKKGIAVPCFADPPFLTWLLYSLSVSTVAHLDVITNGVFVARAVASDLSPDSRFSLLWKAMMEKSVVRGIGVVPLSAFALAGWLLMAAQVASVLLQSMPIADRDLAGKKIKYAYGEVCAFKTACASSWHEFALPNLLDCARMVSLVGPWCEAYMSECRGRSWTRSQIPNTFGSLLHKALTKLVLYSLLESAFQLNLQAASLGLAKAASPTHAVDGITLLSLAISFLTGLYSWWSEYKKASQLAADIANADIDAELKACGEQSGQPGLWDGFLDACRAGTPKEEWERQEAKWTHLPEKSMVEHVVAYTGGLASQRTVRCTFHAFQAVSFLYLGLLARAFIQTGAVLLCPTGLHNFGVGCVDLSS